jgi:hypothetical protein
MSGHYINTATTPHGITDSYDWYFTPCGDGCASVTIGGPTPGPVGQARLVNGQWTMDTTGPATCGDNTNVPSALTSHYTWDPNTLAGTAQLTLNVPACAEPAGYQQTNSVQLRQAP